MKIMKSTAITYEQTMTGLGFGCGPSLATVRGTGIRGPQITDSAINDSQMMDDVEPRLGESCNHEVAHKRDQRHIPVRGVEQPL